MKKKVAALIPLIAVLYACDAMYGVNREAPLEALPSMECIAQAIASTPGVVSVHRSIGSDGTALTLTGPKQPAETSYDFLYKGAEGSHIFGILQIHQDSGGSIRFDHAIRDIDRRPPQEDVDASRPVMIAVENRISKECGLPQLPSHIVEHCAGVECKALH